MHEGILRWQGPRNLRDCAHAAHWHYGVGLLRRYLLTSRTASQQTMATRATASSGASSASTATTAAAINSAVDTTGFARPAVNAVDLARTSVVRPCVTSAAPPPEMMAVLH